MEAEYMKNQSHRFTKIVLDRLPFHQVFFFFIFKVVTINLWKISVISNSLIINILRHIFWNRKCPVLLFLCSLYGLINKASLMNTFFRKLFHINLIWSLLWLISEFYVAHFLISLTLNDIISREYYFLT